MRRGLEPTLANCPEERPRSQSVEFWFEAVELSRLHLHVVDILIVINTVDIIFSFFEICSFTLSGAEQH